MGFLFLATLVACAVTGRLPWGFVVAYALASLVTFFAYGLDKGAARTGRWRTPESTLHGLALLGGWPGAAIAQRALRHKNRKTSFLVVFWFIAILNSGALAWLVFSPGGRALMAHLTLP
ncbi:MAG: DUF1294 domain-containing protein [Xanthomonadales bacterium]|nr:DUF1294 domain-containing protein [Xanthomonadales bacterium]